MISKAQIHKFKRKREIYEIRARDAERNEEEEDANYWKRRLKAVDLKERDAWREDLIQPSSNKFKTHYPTQHLEMEKGAMERELQIKKDKQSREEYWKRYKNTTHHDAAKKVCQM